MVRVIMILAAGTALAGCAARPLPPAVVSTDAELATTVEAAPTEVKPEIGTFGFDTDGMDRSVRPGDDWVQFANGTYLRTLEIPADKAAYGMFNKLDDLSRERTRKIIEAAAAANAPVGTNAQKVGHFYSSFMDEAAIEARGAAPLIEDLGPFRAAR